MKHLKKLLSVLLCLAMVLGLFPAVASAAEEGSVSDYATFLSELQVLEGYANEYAGSNITHTDPNLLMINFLRTGVDRYLDGNWSTLAGAEITAFTEYVASQDAATGTTAMSLRNLEDFTIPNGQGVDFGHMFGALNIAYVAAVRAGDLGGWAGDICDLLLYSYEFGNVPEGTVDEMAAYILENCFGVDADNAFGMNDFYGDMDAYYLNEELKKGATLYALCEAYFTEDQNDADRAEYFMNNRFKGMGLYTQADLREAVFSVYKSNVGLQVLESDRGIDSQDALREACCYAFADYLFSLAGDRLNTGEDTGEGGEGEGGEGEGGEGGGNEGGGNEGGEGGGEEEKPEDSNPYYTVFSSETSTLAPGIEQTIKLALSADNKQLAYYIATVDITREDVNIYANYKDNDPSAGWGMQRVMEQMAAAQAKHSNPDDPEHYIENYYTVVGVNADFYNMSTGKPTGALVMEGVTYSEGNGKNFFAILKDGTPVIGTADQWATYKDNIAEAVGGSIMLVQNGQSVVGHTENYYYTRASRTCIGITAEGQVVLMVLDGRQEPFSAGGAYEELAQIMLDAGCVTAMNLDGGGSSTFAAKQEGSDTVSLINRPSDGYQRSVASSLVVVSTAKPSTEFDHAVITSDYQYLTIGTSLSLTAKGVSNTGYAAAIPEGATWQVADPAIGTITEDGVFTALENGDTQVRIVAEGEVIGSLDLHVVVPNGLAIDEVVKAIYGVPSEVPFEAFYDGNAVAFNEYDFMMGVIDENAGYFEGYSFVGNAESGIRRVLAAVVSSFSDELGSYFELHLFHQDEATFDFSDITGGNRTLAWNREISNSHTYDNVTYTVNDPAQGMDITYTFGLDMESIEIPAQLEDLVYMLPGADAGSTAWDFLLQLAERISVLTEVKVVAQFDPNLDVDISGLTVSNDFFEMSSVEIDENNVITVICKWIDQTQAIDPATANPICVLSGIKAKPKADAAWTEAEKLPIVNLGEVSYKIYLRASSLYSFAQKPENQEAYGLQPFDNPDVIINGDTEKGAYFGATYATFRDAFTLDKQLRQGWYNFDSQLFYFVDHVALTGVQKVPGYEDPSVELFYLFDENGGSQGTITGLFEYRGEKYYAVLGELMTGWRSVPNANGGSDYYYFDASGKAVDGVQTISGRTYTFENKILILGDIITDANGSRYYWAGAPMIGQWIEVSGNTYYATYPKGYFATGMIYVLTPEGDRYQRYIFDDNGVFQADLTGLYHVGNDTYYAENGHIIDEPGLVYIDGYYYYFCSTAKAVKNCNYWISVTNNLLPQGYFHFDEQGRMTNPPEIDPEEPLPELANGIVEVNGVLYYYINGQIGYNAGLIQLLDGSIIYVRSNGQLATGPYWPTNHNGLLPYQEYNFGEDGRMINPPTIYYTVTWVVEGVETSVELAHSELPVYNNGENPSKAPDADYCYEFIGWSPDVVKVVSDATYTAEFLTKAHSGQTTTVDATCTEPGSITVICSHCGIVMSEEVIPATGHVNTTETVVEPTCTEPGSITVTCACGETVSVETIDAIGHSYDAGVVTAPTCTEAGYTTYTCTVCGHIHTGDATEATGHMNTTTVTVEATCTEPGSVTVTCDDCGETVSEETIEATGHEEVTNTVPATCTTDGSITVTCGKCKEVLSTEVIEATGHEEVTNTVPATCTTDGSTTVTCKKCGEVLSTEVIEATGHEEVTSTVPATCTTDGSITVTCGKCKEVLSSEVIEATDHSYTYTDNGDTHTVGCNNCDYSLTEGHTYENGSCACGAKEVTEPAETAIKFGYTVSFDSDLKMNYRIKLENIAAAIPNYTVEGAYLVVEKDQYFADGTTGVDTQTLTGSVIDSRLVFTLNDIQSVEMGSELRAVLHIFDTEGNEYYTPVDVISIKAYAQGFLEMLSYETNPEYVTMLIDLLNYGSAAQTYFGRRADVPANAGMDAYQQYATKELSEELNDQKTVVATERTITAVDKISFSVNFNDKTEMNAKLTLASGYTAEDITCVKVLNAEGDVVETLTEGTLLEDGKVQFTYYGVKSVQLREMYYFVAYVGEEVASDSNGYSVEAYCKSCVDYGTETMADMGLKCMHYGDSAYAYFN